MNGGQRILTGGEMRRSAGDTRMSPALKDAFILLLVLAHLIEKVLEVWHVESAYKTLVRGH